MKRFALLLLSVLVLGQITIGSDRVVSQVPAPPSTTTEEAIQQTELPWRDLRDLAVRVKGIPEDQARVPVPAVVPTRQVGERTNFWLSEYATDKYYSVSATLKVVTPHAYLYVADGTNVNLSKLQEAGQGFEEKVYAADRRYFGSQQATGMDGDAHITILHADIPGLGGYFTSVDEYPTAVHHYSNQRQMFYVNVESLPPATTTYYSVLAHEFEHMIHWNTNRDEEGWVKEGAAEVATEASNLGGGSGVRSFEQRRDTQLNTWADSKSPDVAAHYGASYLFLSYFLDHYGGYEAASDLLTGNTRGPKTFDAFLAKHGYDKKFEDVFSDWVIANYMSSNGATDPKYIYHNTSVRVPATEKVSSTTGWRNQSVSQFAADYLEINGSWTQAKLQFQGDQATRVIEGMAREGKSFWWSNRGDMVDTSLTHQFDLTGLSAATLKFRAWWDTEDGFDYGYVMVSTDGGNRWTAVPATDTTTDNPNGNNLGAGFTGKSGGGRTAQWMDETADLTPFAGKTVLVRFEHISDDAYNAPGFAVDQITIPELGYDSDMEGTSGWTALGFINTDGVLPQHFSVQLIKYGNDNTVEQLPLAVDNQGEVTIDNSDGSIQRAVLVVAATTRGTTEQAHYRYKVELSK